MINNKKQSSTEILKKYMNTSFVQDKAISFFILSGLQDIDRSQITRDLSKELLWKYFANDFLYIQDFSSQLNKTHHIKVAQKDDETYKVLSREYNYKDMGTREINSRLQQSPAGQAKIILIENIERMTIWAINAFLKTCEEPLSHRIIVATTENKSQILETILSRSITVDFSDKKLSWDAKYDFTQDLVSITTMLATDTNIHKKHSLLSEINKKWLIKPFIDEIVAYYISKNDFKNSDKRLNIKKMSTSNVNMDNLLFYWLLA